MKFTKKYFQEIAKIANLINIKEVNNLVNELVKIKKKGGRVFFLELEEVLEIVHMQLMILEKFVT